MMDRLKSIDVFRGVLMISVVLGHTGLPIVHNVTFMFHMPLFFMISGFLLKEDTRLNRQFIMKCLMRYIVPYVSYMLMIFLIFDRNFTLSHILKLAYGGRAIGGVYWFMTCLVFSLIFFVFYKTNLGREIVKALILLGGVIGVVESNLISRIHLLKFPGVLWDLDVALLALVYIAIGFYCKDFILKVLSSHKYKYDIFALVISIVIIAFCVWNYGGGSTKYYLDMKYVYYHELISVVLVPCAFGFVICRLVRLIESIRQIKPFYNALSLLGRLTIPIMFLHIPINSFRATIGYGWVAYTIIGLGIPIIFTIIFCRFPIMRILFGLPDTTADV